ncbi:MAG: flagellar protein FliT [Comamonas sp.]
MLNSLIDYYRAIEKCSTQMLDAARAHDWAGVAQHESASALLISQLRENAKEKTLSAPERKEKAGIMLRILRNDAQLRVVAEPWLAQLDGQMQGYRQTAHSVH